MINISESFDLEHNQDQIKLFEEPTGGKSGEFFFFSSDNRLILKTITSNELMTLLSRLPHYADYVLNNRMTMLSIVYGIYSFHRKEVILYLYLLAINR